MAQSGAPRSVNGSSEAMAVNSRRDVWRSDAYRGTVEAARGTGSATSRCLLAEVSVSL